MARLPFFSGAPRSGHPALSPKRPVAPNAAKGRTRFARTGNLWATAAIYALWVLAARLVQVKNGVHDGALVVFWHRSALVLRLEIGLNKPPILLA
ncbi:MAG: hypothetical protein ABL933_17230 [Methyloglobulus sp.]